MNDIVPPFMRRIVHIVCHHLFLSRKYSLVTTFVNYLFVLRSYRTSKTGVAEAQTAVLPHQTVIATISNMEDTRPI